MKAKVLLWLTVGVTISQQQIQTKFHFEEYDYPVTSRFSERPTPRQTRQEIRSQTPPIKGINDSYVRIDYKTIYEEDDFPDIQHIELQINENGVLRTRAEADGITNKTYTNSYDTL